MFWLAIALLIAKSYFVIVKHDEVHYVSENNHPPIISKEKFEAV